MTNFSYRFFQGAFPSNLHTKFYSFIPKHSTKNSKHPTTEYQKKQLTSTLSCAGRERPPQTGLPRAPAFVLVHLLPSDRPPSAIEPQNGIDSMPGPLHTGLSAGGGSSSRRSSLLIPQPLHDVQPDHVVSMLLEEHAHGMVDGVVQLLGGRRAGARSGAVGVAVASRRRVHRAKCGGELTLGTRAVLGGGGASVGGAWPWGRLARTRARGEAEPL